MRKTGIMVFILALVAAVPALGQAVSKDPAQAASGTYVADWKHTQVLFSVVHLGLTQFHGRFDKISGTLELDNQQPERSTAAITIDTTSLDTPNDTLNNTLKTIFRVQQYPTAVFKSTSITRTGPDTGRMNGLLTIKDVTKPVILDVVFNGSGKSLMDAAWSLGFHATGTIRRSDFGLDRMIWSRFVSDEVQLTIEAQFDKKS